MRAFLSVVLLLGACGPTTRSYDVDVGDEEICRTFEPASETCALTNSGTLRMTVTVEDRGGGEALIYGRSDTSSERVYKASVPRDGRYEVTETITESNEQSQCSVVRDTIVVLEVTDEGLEGGEEYRVVEEKKCNEQNQRRTTRRLREWIGSRIPE